MEPFCFLVLNFTAFYFFSLGLVSPAAFASSKSICSLLSSSALFSTLPNMALPLACASTSLAFFVILASFGEEKNRGQPPFFCILCVVILIHHFFGRP